MRTWFGVCLAAALLFGSASATQPATRAGLAHNGAIVFTSDRDANSELYTLISPGSAQTRLTNNHETDAHPNWSLRGEVAFDRDAGDRTDVWVIRPEEQRARLQVTHADAGVRDVDPSWSPAASELVYSGNASGTSDLYVVNLMTGDQSQLTSGPAADTQPAWSPVDNRIAFVSDRDGSADIWVIRTDGTGLRNLTHTPGVDESGPAWAPDAGRIAFSRVIDGNADIWTMDQNGGVELHATTDRNEDIEPAWSPDGTRIAFASRQDGDFEIYDMFTNGTFQRNLSNSHRAEDRSPSWRMVFQTQSAEPHGIAGVEGTSSTVCTKQGTRRDDKKLKGTPGPDIVCGFEGKDHLIGYGGSDILRGDSGNDVIDARDGGETDEVYGGPGYDVAYVDANDTVAPDVEKKVVG